MRSHHPARPLLLLLLLLCLLLAPSVPLTTPPTTTHTATRLYSSPNPSNSELIEKCQKYFAYRRSFRADLRASSAPSASQPPPPSSIPTTKTSGGSRGNFLLSSLSLSPPSLLSTNYDSPYYDTLDVLDYAEMTRLGYDGLVREVMGVEGGRFEVYGMCGVEVPIVPEEVKRKRTLTPKINLTKEGELQEGMYTGLKLGQSMESEELRLMDEDVGKPKPSFVPSQILPTPKNVPPPQTPNWNAEMLDSRGVELGKVTSWARAQAEISKNNPKVENGSLMVGGRLVRNRNLAFFLGFPVGPALAFGRAGGDNMVGLIGEGAETLRLIGYIITAGWVGVCVLGFKEDGVRGAVFGPGK